MNIILLGDNQKEASSCTFSENRNCKVSKNWYLGV
jgi:hypothetical protein